MTNMDDEKKSLSYTSMKNCNLAVSAVSFVVGFAIVFFSFKLGFGTSKTSGLKAGTWPGIMGIGILLFAFMLLIHTLKNARTLSDVDYTDAHGDHPYRVAIHRPENIKVYLMVLLVIAYSVSLTCFGFYISSFLLIPAIMWFLMPDEKKEDKQKALLQMLLVDVFVLLAIYLIFERALGTQFPQPFWK